MLTTFVILLIAHGVVSTDVYEDIIAERWKLLNRETEMMLGHDVELSDSEKKVNDVLMELKDNALNAAFEQPHLFNMSKHFFKYKDVVKETELFKIIQKMPKGAVLHAHDTGLLRPEYVVNMTYWDDLFVCFEEKHLHFLFSKAMPKSPCQSKWQLMKNARYSSGNVEKFDEKLKKYFTLVINNPEEVYTDVNAVWGKFQQYFITTSGLFGYKLAWEQYFYDTLKAYREDNVMYIEIRSVLPPLYDLNGEVYDSVVTAECYKKVADQFVKDYPDFFGAKLIYAPMRRVNKATLKEYLDIALKIKQKLPGFLAGFDLVGQEDIGVPLKDFLPELVEVRDKLDFFFHAGETNWYGTSTDENLVDAIVLGTKRIGHGYALAKHPYLMNEVIERDIALEVNVISNMVLRLVDDARNHPLALFLAQNLPVVISSDDPGVWEADPMSHDFYVTLLGVASRHADIRLLKKLALNSLNYSTFENKEKMVYEFEVRWAKFIDSVVKKCNRDEF